MKLVWISLVFTRGLIDSVRIGSAICYQMGSLIKAIPYGTAAFQFQTSPVQTDWICTIVDLIPNGYEHIRSPVNIALI